tara:strand:- start:234 stop:407 length:174 start_codon:yes stop_codon:yes gene_type:complete
MDITALIPLLKLFEESGAVSPQRPTFRPPRGKRDDERGITPPSKELPDLGLLHHFKS